MKTFIKSLAKGGIIGIVGLAMAIFNIVNNVLTKPDTLLIVVFSFVSVLCVFMVVLLYNEIKTETK